jgi:hypothetical protein
MDEAWIVYGESMKRACKVRLFSITRMEMSVYKYLSKKRKFEIHPEPIALAVLLFNFVFSASISPSRNPIGF